MASREPRPTARSARSSRCPGIVWLLVFFVAPLYVVLAVVFGGRRPDLPHRRAGLEPGLLGHHPDAATCSSTSSAPTGFFGPALLRTAVYVLIASVLCLVIAFPIAYYVARLAGRWKGLLLALLIAPFWISYMMRMLAWVNLLANDGLVNRIISLNGTAPATRSTGSPGARSWSSSAWSTATCPT